MTTKSAKRMRMASDESMDEQPALPNSPPTADHTNDGLISNNLLNSNFLSLSPPSHQNSAIANKNHSTLSPSSEQSSSASSSGESGGTKKLTIKNRKVRQLPHDFVEKRRSEVREAVEAILKQQPVETTYTELYRSVENLCSLKQSAWLYDQLKNCCEKHVRSQLPHLLEAVSFAHGDDRPSFLEAMCACWRSHCEQMIMIEGIFLHLDRTYILSNSTVLSIWDMGLELFRCIVVNNNVIETKTVEGLLYLIERERRGHQVDRSLLKDLLWMLSSLQLFGGGLDSVQSDADGLFPMPTGAGGANNAARTDRVLVRNMAYKVSEGDLFVTSYQVGHFRWLICDGETGRPEAYGFCEFVKAAGANAALSSFRHYECHSRALPAETRRSELSAEALLERSERAPSELTIETLHKKTGILVQVAKYFPVARWPNLELVSRTFRDAIYEAWRTVRKIRLDKDLRVRPVLRSFIPSFRRILPPLTMMTVVNLALAKLSHCAVNISDIGGFGEQGLDESSINLLVRFEKLERIEFGSISLDAMAKFLTESASRRKLKEVNAKNFLAQQTLLSEEALFDAFNDEKDGLVPLKLETLDLSMYPPLLSWSFLNVIDVSRLASFLVINVRINRSLLASFLSRATKLQRLAFSFDCCCDKQPWRQHAEQETALVLQSNMEIIRAVGSLGLVSLRMNAVFRARKFCECRNFDDEMTQMFNELARRGTLMKLRVGGYLDTPALKKAIATALTNLSWK